MLLERCDLSNFLHDLGKSSPLNISFKWVVTDTFMSYEVKEAADGKCAGCHIILIHSFKIPIDPVQIWYIEDVSMPSKSN